MKYFFSFLFFILSLFSRAQIIDDFNRTTLDGTNPVWQRGKSTGVTGDFTISDSILQANFDKGSSTRKAWFSTLIPESPQTYTFEWEFKVRLDFGPISSSLASKNKVRVYLNASQADLNEGPISYFIECKPVADENLMECRLYFSNGGEEILLTSTSIVQSTLYEFVNVKIRRSRNGDFETWINGISQGKVNNSSLPINGFFGGQIFFSAGSREDKFFFDDFSFIKYPFIDTLIIRDEKTIQLDFSVSLDLNVASILSNYLLNNTENPTDIAINENRITLFFDEAFTPDKAIKLDILSLADTLGNSIPEGEVIQNCFTFSSPDTSPPKVISVKGLQDSLIIIQFDEPILEEDLTTENFILINGVQSLKYISKDTANSYILHFNHPFEVDSTYQLFVSSVSDLIGNTLKDTIKIDFQFKDRLPPTVNNITLINSNSLTITFSESMESMSVLNPKNYLLNQNEFPAATILESDHQVRLVFSQNFPENEILEIEISNIKDQSGNVLTNTWIGNFEYDTEKPSIPTSNGVFPIADTVLQVVFTEAVDSLSARIVNNYRLENTIHEFFPKEVKIDSLQPNVVFLYFKKAFESEQAYSLRVIKVADLSGNVMNNRTRSFYFDTRPPKVNEVKLFSQNRLLVSFNEPPIIDFLTDKSLFKLDGKSPHEISNFYESISDYWLYFDSLHVSDSLLLTIESIADFQGNMMTTADSFYINTAQSEISAIQVLSNKSIEIQFSMPIDTNWLKEHQVFHVNDTISANTINIERHLVVLEFPTNWRQNSVYQLSIDSLRSNNGSMSIGLKTNFTFQKSIVSAYIKDDYQIVLEYGKAMLKDSLRKVQFLLNDISPLQVFSDGTGELITLLFEEKLLPNRLYSLQISPQVSSDGLRFPAYALSLIKDKKAPLVENVSFSDFDEITLSFNEALEENTATAFNHFQLQFGSSSLNFIEITLEEDSLIILKVDKSFIPNETYSLSIANIQDVSGNQISDTTLAIKFPPIPAKGDIIINEIMADPTPSQGLPEAEFIELRNVSSKSINLLHIYLEDESSRIHLGNKEVPPNDYIILCDVDYLEQFEAYGEVFALSAFPAITNSGEKLKLLNSNNKLLDEVNFEDNWHETEKKNGGWSLERIMPDYPCNEADNWRSSVAENGGTPGKENTVEGIIPDTTLPQIISYQWEVDESVTITFSEPMNTAQETINAFKLNGEQIFPKLFWKSTDTLILTFETKFEKGSINKLSVQNLADCIGNIMLPDTFDLINGKVPTFHELLITEIMADPEPSARLPEVEYLEIYNATDQLLDLSDCTLSDATSTTTLSGFILPKSYLVLTSTSHKELFNNTLPVGNFPTLNNAGEALIIKNKNGELVHHVPYNTDWYRDTDKAEGGYALEMIDTGFPCGGAENWLASEHEKGGTPGKENSVINSITDNIPPYLNQVYMLDSNKIELVFSEKMDSLSLVNAEYFIAPSIEIKEIDVPAAYEFYTVQLTLHTILLSGKPYEIGVKNMQDCTGNTQASLTTKTLILPEDADSTDILLSEILFNPSPNGEDFVELYNSSNKYIDLQAWAIANAKGEEHMISEETKIMAPFTFLVLTPSIEAFKIFYPTIPDSLIIEMKLPSFNDDTGIIKLLNKEKEVVQHFAYDESMHFRLLKDEEGVSLERIDYKQAVNNATNWHSAAASVGFATPAQVNSQSNELGVISEECFSVSPVIFSPDLEGVDDFAQIQYACQKTGTVASITIFDVQGKIVRRLIQNQTLANNGFFRWDGTKENGEKANMGYYLIFIETFDLDGNVNTVKLKVAIGARF